MSSDDGDSGYAPFQKIKKEEHPDPIHFKYFKVAPNTSAASTFHVYQTQEQPTMKVMTFNNTCIELINLFNNPDSTVEEMKFGEPFQLKKKGFPEKEKMEKLFGKLFESISNNRIWCKVNTLEWNANIENDTILKLLDCLNPVYLQKLHLTGPIILKEIAEKLMKTAHWRCLTEVKINGPISSSIKNFYHLKVVDIQIKELRPTPLVDFIKNYHKKNLPDPYTFTIRSQNLLKDIIVDQVYGCFNPYNPAEKFEKYDILFVPLRLFKFPNNDAKTRVVFILNGKVSGYVCEKSKLSTSFLQFDNNSMGNFNDLEK